MRGTDQAVRMNKYWIPMRHNLIFKAFVIPLRHLLTFLLSLRYKTSYNGPHSQIITVRGGVQDIDHEFAARK